MKLSNRLFIVLFIMFLVTPVSLKLLGLNPTVNIEKRKGVKFPEFSIFNLENFINEYDAFYKENFGLRFTLFSCYKNFKIKILKESPLPEKVIFGKEGWLFLGNIFGDGLKEQIGIVDFSQSELTSIRDSILGKQLYFDSLKINYYVCIVPNKNTVYSKFLPYRIVENKSKFEQLRSEMLKYQQVKFIDVLSPLNKLKDSVDLYYKSDSHWNRLGAFIAYDKIMSVLSQDFPEIKYSKIDCYSVQQFSKPLDRDLSKMIDEKFVETDFKFIQNEIYKPTIDSSVYFKVLENIIYEARFRNANKKLKIVIFGDSFAGTMIEYLSVNFETMVLFAPSIINKKIIELEKPDIVIQEVVERNIELLLQ